MPAAPVRLGGAPPSNNFGGGGLDESNEESRDEGEEALKVECGILLRLPSPEDERAFWARSNSRALMWDSAACIIGFLNTRALGRSPQMAHLAPQPVVFSWVAWLLSVSLLLQLSLMCLATVKYYRHRTAFTLFNRVSRFLVHAMFILQPARRRGWQLPGRPARGPGSQGDSWRHLVLVMVLSGPLSYIQQPLLYFLPWALHAPLAGANAAMFVAVWVPRHLRQLMSQLDSAPQDFCELLQYCLIAANGVAAALHGAPLHGPAPLAAPLPPRCCRCLLEVASVFATLFALAVPSTLMWRWELGAKARFLRERSGKRLSVRVLPRAASRRLVELLPDGILRNLKKIPAAASEEHALAAACVAALPVALWHASAALVVRGDCAGACAAG